MNTNNGGNVEGKPTPEEISAKGLQVSECMLANSTFTIIGVVVGTFFGLRRKHLRPFVYAITIGTFSDLFYGYTMNCRPMINDYNRAKLLAAPPKMEAILVPKQKSYKLESPFNDIIKKELNDESKKD